MPSGVWYWHILLENSVFSPHRNCLTPHSRWTPYDINVTYTSLKTALNGYNSFADNTVYLHSFSCYCLRNTINVEKFQENLTLQQFTVIQGHRSWCQWKAHMRLQSLIVTLAVSATVFEIFTLKDRKVLILPTLPCLMHPLGGNPLEFLDETYPAKTRGMGVPCYRMVKIL